MRSLQLDEFKSYLDGLEKDAFKKEAFQSYFNSHWVELEEYASFIHFREDAYARNLVSRTDNYELMVFAWLPGQETPIHNHAGQLSWVNCLSGELEFNNYSINNSSGQILSNQTSKIIQGTNSYIDEKINWHSFKNLSSKPAVSVHLFAGPLENAQVYDPESRSIGAKDLNYLSLFGQVPTPESVEDFQFN